MPIRAGLCSSLFLLALISNAGAQTPAGAVPAKPVWAVAPLSQNGQFAGCRAGLAQADGGELAWTLSGDGTIFHMLLSNPSWALPPGGDTSLSYKIDGRDRFGATGRASSPNTMALRLSRDGAVANFSQGKLVTVETAQGQLHYNIEGGALALQQLKACVDNRGGIPAAPVNPSNPFAPRS